MIALGKRTTMPAKMISDIPLPIPRSVICSPSHMMNAVPAVSVIIVIRMKPIPGLSDDSGRALKRKRHRCRLNSSQHDRQISRIGRDLAAAEFAFLRQLFQVGPDDRQQLQDDRRRDVRHDAQRKDGQAAEAASGKQVQKTEHGPGVRAEPVFERCGVDEGNRDVGADAVHREQARA